MTASETELPIPRAEPALLRGEDDGIYHALMQHFTKIIEPKPLLSCARILGLLRMSGLLSFVVSLGLSRAIPDQVEVRFGRPACAAKVQEPAQHRRLSRVMCRVQIDRCKEATYTAL
jgi:hypothetical protein